MRGSEREIVCHPLARNCIAVQYSKTVADREVEATRPDDVDDS